MCVVVHPLLEVVGCLVGLLAYIIYMYIRGVSEAEVRMCTDSGLETECFVPVVLGSFQLPGLSSDGSFVLSERLF